ncbi:MAG: hypothetical protein ACJ738_02335 [Gaiellales bacterium]
MRPVAPGSVIGSSRRHLEGSLTAQVQPPRDAPAQATVCRVGMQPLGLERHRHTGGVVDMSSSR